MKDEWRSAKDYEYFSKNEFQTYNVQCHDKILCLSSFLQENKYQHQASVSNKKWTCFGEKHTLWWKRFWPRENMREFKWYLTNVLVQTRDILWISFYLRRSRQVIERWELLLLLLLLLLLEDYFEVMTSKTKVNIFFVEVTVKLFPLSCSPTIIFLRGGIRGSLTKFFFGVGSVALWSNFF